MENKSVMAGTRSQSNSRRVVTSKKCEFSDSEKPVAKFRSRSRSVEPKSPVAKKSKLKVASKQVKSKVVVPKVATVNTADNKKSGKKGEEQEEEFREFSLPESYMGNNIQVLVHANEDDFQSEDESQSEGEDFADECVILKKTPKEIADAENAEVAELASNPMLKKLFDTYLTDRFNLDLEDLENLDKEGLKEAVTRGSSKKKRNLSTVATNVNNSRTLTPKGKEGGNDQVKSPSDMTLYTPALKRKLIENKTAGNLVVATPINGIDVMNSDTGNMNVVDKISDFVENIRLQVGNEDRAGTATASTSAPQPHEVPAAS